MQCKASESKIKPNLHTQKIFLLRKLDLVSILTLSLKSQIQLQQWNKH